MITELEVIDGKMMAVVPDQIVVWLWSQSLWKDALGLTDGKALIGV
jgi:hypothetical protein